MPLGEIVDISTGVKPEEITDGFGKYRYVNAGTSESGFVDSWNTEGFTTTTPSRGQGGIGYVGFEPERFWCGPLCYRMKSKVAFLLDKYFYYALCSLRKSILGCMKEGGTPAVNRNDLIRLQIPIPSFEEQERIVSILDQFDALVNDISQGLPAEIEARRKQYEYYRDKLLTFKEKVA